MTPENLVRHRLDPNIGFWRQLKEGSDRFEATGEEPLVTVRAGRYAFLPHPDPARETAVAHYRAQEEDHGFVALDEGRPAVRTTYADGGQHPHFAALLRKGADLGEVSRPEALAAAGREVVLAAAKPLRAPEAPPAVAAAGPEVRPLDAMPSVFAPVPFGAAARFGEAPLAADLAPTRFTRTASAFRPS
jgi:hypothetical protein